MIDTPQIPLSFRARRNDSLDQFVAGDNQPVYAALRTIAEALGSGDAEAVLNRRMLYLKGDTGCGKSFLLNALGNHARQAGRMVIYLPLTYLLQQQSKPPAELQGIDLLCLDGIDALCGNPVWEEAVFHYYNQMRASGGYILTAGRQGPANLNISLPDLRSRLGWGEIYSLTSLADSGKIQVLQQQAQTRGVVIKTEVLNYLLKHGKRDLKSLLNSLDQLQEKSFASKRAASIPMLKQVLDNQV